MTTSFFYILNVTLSLNFFVLDFQYAYRYLHQYLSEIGKLPLARRGASRALYLQVSKL